MSESLTLRAVVFRVGDLVCAAPAASVREVLPILPATRIPRVPAAVEGLVNVRGMLLTVTDAHTLLDRPRDPGSEGAILLLDLGGRRLGLIVTEVLDFVALPQAELAAREDLPGLDPRLVRAVGQWEARPFVLLDLDLLVGPTLAH